MSTQGTRSIVVDLQLANVSLLTSAVVVKQQAVDMNVVMWGLGLPAATMVFPTAP